MNLVETYIQDDEPALDTSSLIDCELTYEESDLDGLLTDILSVAAGRAEIVNNMKAALLDNRNEDALKFARMYCDLIETGEEASNEIESNRVN